MNPRYILATATRIFHQLRRDPRTVALMLLVPAIFLVVLRFVFYDAFEVYERSGPLMIAVMTFVVSFVVAAVSTLRERQAGTLERLLILPISRLDIILGYSLTFGLMALLQSGLVTAIVIGAFNISLLGSVWHLLLIAVASGLTGMAFGLFLSGFAKNEFQAVQFMPAFVLPQILVCGIFVPREEMLEPLQLISHIAPLTYSVEAVNQVVTYPEWTSDLTLYVSLLGGITAVLLLLAALSMRQK